jgi:acyl carrier protein
MSADDVDARDSMSYINFILPTEIAFEIEFQQHEIQNFANVDDLKQSIATK